MSIHYVIITDLANPKHGKAHLDVGSDQAIGVRYAVVPSASPAPPGVLLNDKQFVSSPDCFALASALPALVFATTTDAGVPPTDTDVPSQATLRQNQFVMAVPPAEVSLGTQFAFAIGDLGQGAFLLIGNPDVNPTDAPVEILASPLSAIANLTVPLNGVVIFQLPSESAHSRVAISSGTGIPLLVQLAVLYRGQNFAMTIVPRSAP